jgi:hypothetical protein
VCICNLTLTLILHAYRICCLKGRKSLLEHHKYFFFKGIVSRDSVSTETIGVQFRPNLTSMKVFRIPKIRVVDPD